MGYGRYRNLSQDEVETMTIFFQALDKDRDGYITVDEIKRECAVDMNRDGWITPEEADRSANPWLAIIAKQDKNGDGRISLDELLQFNDDFKGKPLNPAASAYGHPPPAAPYGSTGYPPAGAPPAYSYSGQPQYANQAPPSAYGPPPTAASYPQQPAQAYGAAPAASYASTTGAPGSHPYPYPQQGGNPPPGHAAPGQQYAYPGGQQAAAPPGAPPGAYPNVAGYPPSGQYSQPAYTQQPSFAQQPPYSQQPSYAQQPSFGHQPQGAAPYPPQAAYSGHYNPYPSYAQPPPSYTQGTSAPPPGYPKAK